MHSIRLQLGRVAAIAFLLGQVSLPAQTAVAAPAENAESPAAREAALELSPFTVQADRDVGYQAANTLAGSRLNTSLKDTPATIDVLTSEFLSDVGATSLTDALVWGNNVQQDLADTAAIGAAGNDNTFFQVGPSFRVRGIGATLMRNYFQWNLAIDNYNMDRVEEGHGPNSILFGIGSAGGIINVSTKQAVIGRSFRRVDLTASSFGGYRGALDVNQSTGNGKLGLRLNALYDHAGDFHTYGYSNKRRVDLAGTYHLTSTTRVRFEYETGTNRENITSYGMLDGLSTWLAAGRPTYSTNVAANTALGIGRYGSAARVTFIGNNNSVINMASRNFGTTNGAVIMDPNLADPYINGGGPGQLRNIYFDATSVFVEQRVGEHTNIEFAYNHQLQHGRVYRLASGDSDGGALSFDPNTTLSTGAPNPFAGRLMLDAAWQRVDREFRGDYTRLTLSHERDFGRWGKYRVAGLAEYDYTVTGVDTEVEVWGGAPFNVAPENAANQVYRRNYVTEHDWSTYYHNGPAQLGLIQNLTDPVTGRTLSSTWAPTTNLNDDPTKQSTLLGVLQAHYFRDRLIIGAGLRHDSQDVVLRNVVRDPVTNRNVTSWNSATRSSYTGRTRTLGAVAHLTHNLSLIYNQSDNFSLPVGTLVLPNSQRGPNPVGKGKDVGIAVTALDGKMYARAVYFQSGVNRIAGAHGFGVSTTAPANVSANILGALLAQGLITQADADARTVRANGVLYDRASDGYELNLVGNPTNNWRVQVNYSYTNSAEKNIGTELKAWAATALPYFKSFDQNLVSGSRTLRQIIADFETAMTTQFALEGTDVGGNRKQKVNVFTRYSFSSGPLKGAFVGGGYVHQSKTVAGEATSLGPILYGRSYWLANLLVGYQLQHVPMVGRLKLQLNVANLFDADKPLVTSVFPDNTIRRAVPLTPRTWQLSAQVEF